MKDKSHLAYCKTCEDFLVRDATADDSIDAAKKHMEETGHEPILGRPVEE